MIVVIPDRYEGAIATLCDNLESLDEPEARASMVWIIGEYAERIDNAAELIDGFLDGFLVSTRFESRILGLSPKCFPIILIALPGRERPGAAAAADGDGEAVPEAAVGGAGDGAAGARPRHAGQRQPRPARQGVHLLAPPLHRPRSSQERVHAQMFNPIIVPLYSESAPDSQQCISNCQC